MQSEKIHRVSPRQVAYFIEIDNFLHNFWDNKSTQNNLAVLGNHSFTAVCICIEKSLKYNKNYLSFIETGLHSSRVPVLGVIETKDRKSCFLPNISQDMHSNVAGRLSISDGANYSIKYDKPTF